MTINVGDLVTDKWYNGPQSYGLVISTSRCRSVYTVTVAWTSGRIERIVSVDAQPNRLLLVVRAADER